MLRVTVTLPPSPPRPVFIRSPPALPSLNVWGALPNVRRPQRTPVHTLPTARRVRHKVRLRANCSGALVSRHQTAI